MRSDALAASTHGTAARIAALLNLAWLRTALPARTVSERPLPRPVLLLAILSACVAPAAGTRASTPDRQHPCPAWHVETAGAGRESIIFLPGIGSRPWVFDDLKARLGSDYRLLSVTLAGMGGTRPSASASIGRAAQELSALIRARPGPVHLVGHSMGGIIALRVGEEAPANLATIIILDAAPVSRAGEPPTDMEDRIRRSAEAMVPRDEDSRPAALADWVAGMTSPAGRPRVLADFLATDPDELRARLRETTTLLRLLEPERIRVPVHVLGACSGSEDCAAKADQLRSAYEGTPAFRLEMVEASHYVMLDRPRETKRFVLEALGREPGGP